MTTMERIEARRREQKVWAQLKAATVRWRRARTEAQQAKAAVQVKRLTKLHSVALATMLGR